MAGPGQALKPTEEVGLKPVFHSELASISQKYGLDLTRTETSQIVEKAAGNLKKAPADVQERLEKALFSYIKSTDPARAFTLYNQMEGRKFWEKLDIDDAKITFQGKQTTMGAALATCATETDAGRRMGMFIGLAGELAERFRLGENHKNSFGIKYDRMATDPADLLSEKSFNCFSGSMALGQMISYAAGQLGVQDNVKPKLQLVASWSMNGKVWDDTGHALLRLDVTTGKGSAQVFFDPMNTVVAKHEKELVLNPADNTLQRPADPMFGTKPGGMSYRLSDQMAITPELVAKAQFQDRLFSVGTIDAATANQIARMPPVLIGYYASNLSTEQQKSFFRNYGIARTSAIERPAQRYQLAAFASSVLAETDRAAAIEYGKIALSAMKEAVTGDMSELVRMPMGSYLQKTLRLVSLMSQSEETRAMLPSSRAWVYLPYVINVTPRESMDKATAREARDFLAGFYLRNPKTIANEGKANPWGLLICTSSMLKLNDMMGSTEQSEKALDRIYGVFGIDRQQLLLKFKSIAPETQAFGLNKESITRYLSSPASARQFENAFLAQCAKMITRDQNTGKVTNKFSVQQLRYFASTAQGEDAILGNVLYRMFSDKARLASVMLPQGTFQEEMYASGLLDRSKAPPPAQKTAQK